MESKLSMRLRGLRKSKSFTIEYIVKKLKQKGFIYTIQSIYKWEQGKAIPPIKVLIELSRIYKCNISYLIEEKDYDYISLTPSELNLLRLFREDFLFRSISMQVIRKLERSRL
ncbi:MAG: helix-turn-helix transcriptional regulator [Lachnospiraceae bacterium]|nr:helix-turn-helix transcriptional regulator [Lachnospiraceae bacterium]